MQTLLEMLGKQIPILLDHVRKLPTDCKPLIMDRMEASQRDTLLQLIAVVKDRPIVASTSPGPSLSPSASESRCIVPSDLASSPTGVLVAAALHEASSSTVVVAAALHEASSSTGVMVATPLPASSSSKRLRKKTRLTRAHSDLSILSVDDWGGCDFTPSPKTRRVKAATTPGTADSVVSYASSMCRETLLQDRCDE